MTSYIAQLFVDFIVSSYNAYGSKPLESQLSRNNNANDGSNWCELHSAEEKLGDDTLCPPDIVKTFKLKNLLNVSTSNCSRYFLTRKCCYLMHCLQIKTNFGYSSLPDKKILTDDRVTEAIERCVAEQLDATASNSDVKSYNQLIKLENKYAAKVLKNMKAALSSTFIRITGYVLFKVFRWMFSSVIVTEEQLGMIKIASKRNLPLIFVPLHRSHIDYLFVTWILFNMEVRAPLVAAGDNLRLPVFGNLLRSLGGFFIKRKLESSKDSHGYIYRSILQTYMSRALISGCNLEFFIEGGRTRTGKPCMPKGGLLSVVVDAFLSGHLCDALIIPIAINYDKLIDGPFVTEQLGHNKVPETFWGAVRAIIKTLRTNFGNARIDFSQPFSLKEYYNSTKMKLHNLNENKNELGIDDSVDKTHCRSLSNTSIKEQSLNLHQARSNSSLFGSVVSDDYRKFVNMLGSHIIYDAERCQAIMASNVLAWLLSFAYRDGTSLLCLVDEFRLMNDTLIEMNRDMGYSGATLDVVIHAIEMLGSNLVHVEENITDDDISKIFIRPITELPSIIELNYYANALLPVFAVDCITATALVSLIDCEMSMYNEVATKFTIKDSLLSSTILKLCDLLCNEFVLVPPCHDLSSKINNSINKIIIDGLLEVNEDTVVRPNHYYSDESEEEEEDNIVLETLYKLNPTPASMKKLTVLTKALAPILETYYSTACNLVTLLDNPMPEKEFITSTQTLICNLMSKNAITYGESVAADPIRNALKKFESDHVIDSYISQSKKIISIGKVFESEELLYPLIKGIHSFNV